MIVYYHLPKTGGRGICQWLQRELKGDYLQIKPANEALVCKYIHFPETRAFTTKAVGGHDTLEVEGYKGYTTLREPAERLWSRWCHLKRVDPNCWGDFESFMDKGFCKCLWCTYPDLTNYPKYHQHKSNPITWFYASRTTRGIEQPKDPYEVARGVLLRSSIYGMCQQRLLVNDLARELKIKSEHYQPVDITGSGIDIPGWARKVVAKRDKMDYELWNEFGS